MKVITAKNGQTLRDFAESSKLLDLEKTAIFPEAGLSPLEQSKWLADNKGKYTEVVTFSAYIISDSDDVTILDGDEDDIVNQGDSINKVTMVLWNRMTIGQLMMERINGFRNAITQAHTQAEIDLVINSIYDKIPGDSVEKTLLIKTALDKEF